jgi:large subunit ribosomal protein L25
MAEPELSAVIRETAGKADAGRLRNQGLVPCTIYGIEKESSSLAINKKELEKLLANAQSVIKINVSGGDQRSVIKEIQYHPVKGDIIHVDFMRIKAGQEIHVTIPLKFVGDAPGIKMGGVFQTIRSEMDISTLPKYMPNEIEVDISEMEIGDTLHLSDLTLENITVNHDPETTLCSIVMPKKVEEIVEEEEEGLEEEGEEAEEPEVISSKAKDEDSTETEG